MVLSIQRNRCPYCDEDLYVNKKTFANHVRWCNSNPNYDNIRNSTIQKIKETFKNKKIKTDYILHCEICGKEYHLSLTENAYNKGHYKKCCSSKCSHILVSKKINKEEKNNKIKNTLYKGPHIKNCEYCGKQFTTYKSKQKFCCKECGIKNRYKNVDLKKIYKSACAFTFSLNEFPKEFNFNLIEEFGWYKAKNHGNNLTGISRDHKYSVNEGFNNMIDPYIISHPANCELLQHTENISKNYKCSITLEELKSNILIWNNLYGEYPNKIDYDKFKKFNILW